MSYKQPDIVMLVMPDNIPYGMLNSFPHNIPNHNYLLTPALACEKQKTAPSASKLIKRLSGPALWHPITPPWAF